jgi:hypothetical protein
MEKVERMRFLLKNRENMDIKENEGLGRHYK